MALIWDGSEYIEDNSDPSTDPSTDTKTDTSSSGGGNSNEGSFVDPNIARDAAVDARRKMNVLVTLKSQFEDYGLSSLYPKIVDFVTSGYDSDAIAVLLRATDEYKARFPAMAKMAAEKRAITEGEYVDYEKTAKGYEVRYGLPSGMLMGSVTKLLEGAVSPTELNERVVMASSASVSAPQDVKDTLKKYYNVDSGGLAAYFLDPQLAMPLLEKQYNSSLIGTEASRQSVDLAASAAEELQQMGVSTADAQVGFGNVNYQKGLSEGKGDVLTQSNLIDANLKKNADASKEVARVGLSRAGRFQGGGGFSQNDKGVSGLSSSSI